jgi:hypothetical protein
MDLSDLLLVFRFFFFVDQLVRCEVEAGGVGR